MLGIKLCPIIILYWEIKKKKKKMTFITFLNIGCFLIEIFYITAK